MSVMSFTNTLSSLIQPASIAGYYEERLQNVRPYLGAALFPPSKVAGLEIKTILGKAGHPVLLRQSAFDANAPIRPRIGFRTLTNEMPFFREGMIIGEKERQELMSRKQEFVQPFIDRIYDDAFNLVLGADAVLERMRMALLSTGEIKVQNELDGAPFEYYYGFDPATQSVTLTGSDAWNQSTTANPLKDIENALRTARMSRARAILTADTFMKLIAADQVRGAMFVPDRVPTYITPGQISDFIQSAMNLLFIVIGPEENTYTERVGGEARTMFPDGVVTLIPETGAVGTSFYGTTPEEADLMVDSSANVSVVNTGVAITQTIDPGPPVNVKTYVSQIALPSCERIDRIFIMNVFTPEVP